MFSDIKKHNTKKEKTIFDFVNFVSHYLKINE